jgi:hypothetical protein
LAAPLSKVKIFIGHVEKPGEGDVNPLQDFHDQQEVKMQERINSIQKN